MNPARPFWQQAIVGHRIEDARLSQEHDQHGGGESGEGAQYDDDAAPAHACGLNSHRDRSGCVEAGVVNDTGERQAERHV
jgi:hypothetical protein